MSRYVNNFTHYLILLLFLVCAPQVHSQTSHDIRLNQVGFLPNSIKYAAVVNSESNAFSVKTSDLSVTVLTGKLSSPEYFTSADEDVRIADFSSLDQPGVYVLQIDGLGQSVPFSVQNDIFIPISKALIKGFYFNRASTELLPEHAGIFSREAGHPDTAVVVHPSGASVERPAGTIILTPYGWYDAGDYNKYIVNSGISTFTLLSAYESYPQYFDTLSLNIPESDNNIPDILDEAMWNIKWMMSMQDPNDGGVYNKTTTASFEHQVKPSQAVMTRYVITKTTAATLDFAAIMAMTARIYKPYLPALADEVLEMSKNALDWAKANPDIPFSKPQASGIYPSISTGSYGDEYFEDEFSWCAAELYITTKDDKYYEEIQLDSDLYDVPNSGSVRTLGLLSLLVNRKNLTSVADTNLAKQKLLGLIKPTKNNTINTPYRIPGEYFGWGGNAIYGNRGMLLMQAYSISKDAGYFNAAVSTLDYLLGRNATSYCFVTGQGAKSPKHIHHRISTSDAVADPVPGLLAGGPNPGNVDKDCGASQYPSLLPAKAYLDQTCSYTTNEIAINWSAPLVFLAGGIQAAYLTNFEESMASYLILSVTSINLPFKSGSKANITLSANTDWTLSSSVNWINFSSTSGEEGWEEIIVSANEDNPGEETREAYIYVSSNDKVVDSVYVSQNGVRKDFRLEAENFIEMFGLQTESTLDLGGGENIGYVDINDWVDYNIEVSYHGVYQVNVRHAGMLGGFDILIDGLKVQSVSVPATNDWQDWESHGFEITLPEGSHTLRFAFTKQGVNLNWFQFNWLREPEEGVFVNPVPDNDLTLYPVPASEYIILSANKRKVENIEIYSIHGKLVYNDNTNGLKTIKIDLSDVSPGIYILKARMASGIIESIKMSVENK